MSVTLTPDQDAAVTAFLNFLYDPLEREMVLEGYPGCGKSFVTKYMLEALKNNNQIVKMLGAAATDIQPLLTATTNKAAKVLGEFVGTEAVTIHSALGLKVYNDYRTGETKLQKGSDKSRIEKMNNALIIIDEASYIDDFLLDLIQSSTFDCKILYIGDRYQLANVKCQKPPVFYQIENKAVLSTSKRFAENGAIANLAQQMRDTIDSQQWKPIVANGVDILSVDDYEYKSLMQQEFNSITHKIDDARILAWTNRQVQLYNNFVRSQFTKDISFMDGEQVVLANSFMKYVDDGQGNAKKFFLPVESVLTVSGTPYPCKMTFGAKGIEQWEIDCYEINFDNVGSFYTAARYEDYYALLKLIKKQIRENRTDWSEYFKVKETLLDVRPNFATTVYKAQGSTYKKVFIDLADIGKCHQWEQVARMLHVAVSRASEQVIFRGQLPNKYR